MHDDANSDNQKDFVDLLGFEKDFVDLLGFEKDFVDLLGFENFQKFSHGNGRTGKSFENTFWFSWGYPRSFSVTVKSDLIPV